MKGRRTSRRLPEAALLIVALTVSAPAIAQQPAPAAPSGSAGVVAPAVAPEVERLLEGMSAYLGSAQEFTFHADITFDHVLLSGQKLQFSAAEDVALQRPGRLYVEWSGDLGNRQFWYDGKSVTLYDPSTPFYADQAAPGQLDSMLDELLPKLHFSPPLADLLYSNPYEKVRTDIQVRVRPGVEPDQWPELPDASVRGKEHRLADLDRRRPATDPVQAGDHLQKPAIATAIQRTVHRLGFRSPHRNSGVHAVVAGWNAEDRVPNSGVGTIARGAIAMKGQLAHRSKFTMALLAGVFTTRETSVITPTAFSRAIPSPSTTRANSSNPTPMRSKTRRSFGKSHPETQQNSSQFQQNRANEANTLQQNRTNEANALQQNRSREADYLQYNRVNTYNHYSGSWGGYYSGLGFGAGIAVGATLAVLPAAAMAISVAGNPYYYTNGVYYAPQGGQYAVVPPPQGAVVSTPPPSCSTVFSGSASYLDCGVRTIRP